MQGGLGRTDEPRCRQAGRAEGHSGGWLLVTGLSLAGRKGSHQFLGSEVLSCLRRGWSPSRTKLISQGWETTPGICFSELGWSLGRRRWCLQILPALTSAEPLTMLRAGRAPGCDLTTHRPRWSAHRQARSTRRFCSDQEETLELEHSKLSMAPGF